MVERVGIKADAGQDFSRVGAEFAQEIRNLYEQPNALASLLVLGNAESPRGILAPADDDSQTIHCHDCTSLPRIVKPDVLNCQPFRRELSSRPFSSVRLSSIAQLKPTRRIRRGEVDRLGLEGLTEYLMKPRYFDALVLAA